MPYQEYILRYIQQREMRPYIKRVKIRMEIKKNLRKWKWYVFIIGTRNSMKRGIREIYEKKRLVKEYMDYSVNVNETQGVFSSWEIAMNVMSKMENDNIELSNDIICEVMNAAYECGKS